MKRLAAYGGLSGALVIAFSLLTSLLWSVSAYATVPAAELRVCASGCPYTSIQAAVDAAGDGDVIKIAAGTYHELHARARHDVVDTGLVTQVLYIDKNITIQGGYTDAFNEPPDSTTNVTRLDARGMGRVLYITGRTITPTIKGIWVRNGNASGQGGILTGGDAGGGIYVYEAAAMFRSVDVSLNEAPNGDGGGMYLYSSNASLETVVFLSNTAARGGGLFAYFAAPTVTNTAFCRNRAVAEGGGIYFYGTKNASLSNSYLLQNEADEGGGLYSSASDVVLQANQVMSNTAGKNGGGLYLSHGSALIEGNGILHNNATSNGAGIFLSSGLPQLIGNIILANIAGNHGGGIHMWSTATDKPARIVNTVLARNQAGTNGAALYLTNITGVPVEFVHNTIAQNSGGTGRGVYLLGSDLTAVFTNTILVSHTVGLYASIGTEATMEGTLFGSGAWADAEEMIGGPGTVEEGTWRQTNDPGFVAPEIGDYHLAAGSSAIDQGINGQYATDIDGDTRPYGAHADLGADEALASNGVAPDQYVYLPLVKAN